MESLKDFKRLIDEAIRLELIVSDLYFLFHSQFPEDSEFWWALAMEEVNHASLLRTVRQMETVDVPVPDDLLPANIEELVRSTRLVKEMMEAFEKEPDREKAFRFSYQVENSAGELHYDTFMKHAPESTVAKVFRKLNGNDLDHAQRIKEYSEAQNIQV